MKLSRWIMDKFIYVVVFVLLALMCATIIMYATGVFDYYAARVYLEVFTGVSTLALLFYAYSNAVSKREDDTARLELAVRPIFVWELNGGKRKAALTYKSIKHPTYDLHMEIRFGGETLNITDRHIDVYDERADNHRERDITNFVSKGLGRNTSGELDVRMSCHSEVGGRYEFEFTKEVAKGRNGFTFHHRKLVSAKYPWKDQPILFNDEDG